MSDYTKLSNLVNDTFTVNKVFGYKFKMWDNEQRKMLISDSYVQGYRKMYTIETDKGTLDLSASQMGNILESVTSDGRADINGRTFSVKSNGKSGMDIRYYINAMKDSPTAPVKATETSIDEEFDMSSIPF